MNAAVIVAAGESTRMGREKSLLLLSGKEVLRYCIEAFDGCPDIDRIVVVTSASRLEEVSGALAQWYCSKPCKVVAGGSHRGESVYRGLEALPGDCGIVAIHDGARPFVDQQTIRRSIESAQEKGSGVAGIATTDTIKIVDECGRGTGTLERDSLLRVQTPQTFRYDLILKAYEKAMKDGFLATDDSAVAEHAGHTVYFVQGSQENMKLTRPEDIAQAEAILRCRLGESGMYRSGIGYDAHRLVADRKLVLGGVEIPHTTGLLGHSDADVLVHAIMDALLGAAALGDIGKHFPDSDPAYAGASSLRLLERVGELLRSGGWQVVNIDSIVVAQKPRLMPHIPAMVQNIAERLNIQSSAVSVKATTTERMGYEGREEGISAQAIAMIRYATPTP